MYTYVSALVKPGAPGSRWQALDISQMSLSDIFRLYAFGYATLSNPLYSANRTLDLNTIRDANDGSTTTLSQYLTNLGDASLTTSTTSYSIQTKYAHFSDARRSKYKIEPIAPLANIGSSVLNIDRDWLSVTRDGTDIDLLFKSCLVSVNGLIHRTDSDGERLYVMDGMKSARHANKTTMGLTSFQNLGELEFVNLTPVMMHRRYPDTPFASRMYIDLGQAYDGIPILVLGGYMHVLDTNVFSRISDSIFVINFQNFPLRDRYFESLDLIDLTPLGLDHNEQNPRRIDDAELHSDEVLIKYATLSQSFIAFLSNEQIFVEREVLRQTRIVNTYTVYDEPVYPMIAGVGKLSDYWRVEEDGQWAVKIDDGIRANYEFNTTLEANIVCIDDGRTPGNPIELSRTAFLKIGSDSLVAST